MAAAFLADLLGIVLILLGIEHWTFKPDGTGVNAVDLDSIAWSHGLLPDVLWAGLLAGSYFLWRRDAEGRVRGTWILFAAVLSHWILDFVSHKPDMPMAPGLNGRYGLGVWTSLPATLLVEGLPWLIALWIYVRATRASGRTSIFVFWPAILLLTLAWIGNFTGGRPAGGSLTIAAISSLTFFTLLVAWAYWMDRIRKPAYRTSC
jgi:hypothetical protein